MWLKQFPKVILSTLALVALVILTTASIPTAVTMMFIISLPALMLSPLSTYTKFKDY